MSAPGPTGYPQYPGVPSYAPFPPGYGFPSPPKKSRIPAVVGAVLVAAGLIAGGAYAYGHYVKKDGTRTTSASAATQLPPVSSAPPVPVVPVVPAPAPAGGPQLGGAYTAQEQAYIDRLTQSGINVHTPALAVHDGHDACGVLHNGGTVLDAVKLMEKYNASMGEIGAIVTTVTAVQVLCPQDSTFGVSTTTANPLPPGADGEYIRRLQDVGLSVDNQGDAIGDGRKACAIIAASPTDGFLTAAQTIHDANPRAGKTAAIFMIVTALQVYCPPA